MTIKQNVKANFWIRLLATLIDLLIFIVLIVATSFIIFNYKKAEFRTQSTTLKEIYFRLWLLLMIFLCIFEYIVIPTILKGQTIGMLICKIKILSDEEKRRTSKFIFDRQRLFAFLWIFVFMSFMLMSTDAFLKAARGGKLNNVEKLVVILPTALATISINLQILLIISGISSTRLSWNDKLSRTKTVWKNRYEDIIEDENLMFKIKPKKRELPKINITK
ncbi:RDD family protein [Mycoplasma sp. 332]|uniref:RDD family protein n=1 Tax=Mycoplasma sp. 332 TaxID=3458236 RepID=UPI004036D7E3